LYDFSAESCLPHRVDHLLHGHLVRQVCYLRTLLREAYVCPVYPI
jgi:hypothetical protein